MTTTYHRLQQTISHLQPPRRVPLSLVAGPTDPPLLNLTLGQLLARQVAAYGALECLVFPWTGARWTYADLNNEADNVARGLLAMGVQRGDRVGIIAGNCEQYISVFFGVARVGAILVVLNNTYTAAELDFALTHSGLCTLPLFGVWFTDVRARLPRLVRYPSNRTTFARGHIEQFGPTA